MARTRLPQTNDPDEVRRALRDGPGIDLETDPFIGTLMQRRLELEQHSRIQRHSRPVFNRDGVLQFAPLATDRQRPIEWQERALNAAAIWLFPQLRPMAFAIIEGIYLLDGGRTDGRRRRNWLTDEAWGDPHEKAHVGTQKAKAGREHARQRARRRIEKAKTVIADPSAIRVVARILSAINRAELLRLIAVRSSSNHGRLATGPEPDEILAAHGEELAVRPDS